ncbi:MAG: 50S ribosome-binding GTPase, partial [Fimbriimonas ginsengisoli]|nr:50S ribosome-binding GTPase [Fimbriimonas ginsengisoli]
LTQAEAVRDTVEAQTALQLELASRQRMGGLAMEVSRIREECLRVLAAVEASLDFSDEIGPVDRGSASSTLKTQIEAIDRLLDTARIGRILRQGFRIAILGRPNAGKSSLLNAYLRQDRAIDTPTPGTTRDLIEEAVDFDGLKAVLIDTAGLRDTRDSVEKIGVERARVAATGADLRWYLYDVAAAWTAEDERQLAQLPAPTFRIAAKCDLVEARAEDPLRVSSKTGEGLAALAARSTQMALQGASLEAAVIAPRHEEPLQAAREALTDALGTISAERPDDLAAVGLGHAIAKLGEITGETATPDIIERIFHDFCIGK